MSKTDEKPIEYWISRATDPYLDVETRKKHLAKLCDRVNFEIEGAQIATGILSHKVVSPDQDEALYALQAVDALVRGCGEKVHVKVGKFRFLNQLVKLVTPKYLANQTSPEVKELAIQLLYTWQRSMKHVEKFKEVYETLKEHKVITKDPEIPEDQIMVVRGPSPKLAEFEDEDKARILNELLRSRKPDDLQAANRMIKSLVRNSEQKSERAHQRSADLAKANVLCNELHVLLLQRTTESIGMTAHVEGGLEKLKDTFDELLTMRPVLFQYAGEAAESQEEILVDILKTNDQVNRWIQAYRDAHGMESLKKTMRGSEEECADLLGPEPLELPSSDFVLPSSSSSSVSHVFEPMDHMSINKDTLVDTATAPETVDVPFIGFDRMMTPALARRQVKTTLNGNTPLNFKSLLDDDIFGPPTHEMKAATAFYKPKPTLRELTDKDALGQHNLDMFKAAPEEKSRIMDSLIMDPSLFEIDSTAEAHRIMDQGNIRILAYPVRSFIDEDIKGFIISIMNVGAAPIERAFLVMNTETSGDVQFLLQSGSSFNLAPIDVYGQRVSAEYRMMCVSANGVREVEFDFSLLYRITGIEHTITGSTTLSMKRQ